MEFLFNNQYWHTLEMAAKVFWTLAVITTFLYIIWLLSSFLWKVRSDEQAEGNPVSPRAMLWLGFLLSFSWVGAILLTLNVKAFWALLASIMVPLLFWLFQKYFPKAHRLLGSHLPKRTKVKGGKQQVFSATGKVLESIPPHQMGFGKVYLDSHGLISPLDAVTIGHSLPVGSEVRVVKISGDNKTLVVEPIPKGMGEDATR